MVPAAGADTSLSNVTAAGAEFLCKSWVSFDASGTVSILDSFNTASITDNGVGNFLVNIDTDMANANYCCLGASSKGGGGGSSTNSTIANVGEAVTAAQYSIYLVNSGGATAVDRADIYGATFGDLS